MHKEEQEFAAESADLESQIAALKASAAEAERTFARRQAANVAPKPELEMKVDSFTGPSHRLSQLKTEEATSKIQELTDATLTPQWLSEVGP